MGATPLSLVRWSACTPATVPAFGSLKVSEGNFTVSPSPLLTFHIQ